MPVYIAKNTQLKPNLAHKGPATRGRSTEMNLCGSSLMETRTLYLHFDAGDEALASPVHRVWNINAWRPHERRWRPLDVVRRSERGVRLHDLLCCLSGSRKHTRKQEALRSNHPDSFSSVLNQIRFHCFVKVETLKSSISWMCEATVNICYMLNCYITDVNRLVGDSRKHISPSGVPSMSHW